MLDIEDRRFADAIAKLILAVRASEHEKTPIYQSLCQGCEEYRKLVELAQKTGGRIAVVKDNAENPFEPWDMADGAFKVMLDAGWVKEELK